MPEDPVDEDDNELLECGCKIKDALIEEIYVQLGFIGEDVAKKRAEESGAKESGWKALSRPERERILMLLEILGHDLHDLVENILEEKEGEENEAS